MSMTYDDAIAAYEKQSTSESDFAMHEDTSQGEVFVSVMIAKIGRWRPHLSIEFIVQMDDKGGAMVVSSALIEKFPNGKSYVVSDRKLGVAVFAIALIALCIVCYRLMLLRW